MTTTRTVGIYVRVDPTFKDLLDRMATDLDVSPQWIIRRAVRNYIDFIKDGEDIGQALPLDTIETATRYITTTRGGNV